ncbi:metallophosphoesterase [Paenibacillus sp. GYB003]|uniref:metallophosphoesterase n=1 Tax=Paenibacillus sp. GYB003 TaxID=2994392 RepID=UPI002F966916
MMRFANDRSQPPAVIESFDTPELVGVRSVNANHASIDSECRPEYVRHGTRSLRLDYDFTGAVGTSAAYLLFHETPGGAYRKLAGYPRKIGVWVYGDGSGHWLRGLLIDGENQSRPIDFTAKGGLLWHGWKYVRAAVPEGMKLPVSLAQLYIVETDNGNKNRGVCYFDRLQAEYDERGEDWSGPEFGGMTPRARQTVYAAAPEIGAVVRDDESGVDGKTVRMTVDGVDVPFAYDASSGRISYVPERPLSDGEHTVVIEASDRAGNPAVPHASWTFAVYTGPDRVPPDIRIVSPLPDVAVNTDCPRIAAIIRDEQSGVDFAQVRVSMDGRPRRFYVHNDETVYFTVEERLEAHSVHEVTIRAADKAGNPSECSWTFRVGRLPGQPRRADRFQMTIIGDGGYYTADSRVRPTSADLLLTEQIARIRREPSELIGYTGDIVEHDTAANYAEAKQRMNGFHAPVLIAIGNHEVSGTGSRLHYQHHFGDPTYTYVFGNTRFIVLDSASGHLTSSDASQWPWLEQVLEASEQPNIFVLMHVPPDQISASGEDFNTGHGFQDKREADRFYDLLGACKRRDPDRNIVVFSGDFHVYHHKVVQGVHYVISGGGGKQAHIAPEKGGFYHYLNVRVDGRSVTWDVVPLLQSIAWAEDPVTMRVGSKRRLRATGTFMTASNRPIVMPIGAPFRAVWTSERPDIAEVDQDGTVTARAPGETFVAVECGWQTGRVALNVVPSE